jgi:hypothetical protein
MRRTSFAAAALLLASLPALAVSQAPAGTYTATSGNSAATGSVTGSGGAARGSKTTSAGSGSSITMSINNWATQADLESLAAAEGDPKAFLDLLAQKSFGTVTLGGRAIPVNLAWSFKSGASYQIVLLSEKPFAATSSRTGATGSGVAVGYIRLTVDGSGIGSGMLYSTTQVAIQSGSDIVARGGASSATQLTNVARQ